jgi:hypothetical protein
MVGTLPYRAPEILRPEAVDAASGEVVMHIG